MAKKACAFIVLGPHRTKHRDCIMDLVPQRKENLREDNLILGPKWQEKACVLIWRENSNDSLVLGPQGMEQKR